MPRNIVNLPSFSGVAASQTTTIDLPVVDTYHKIQLTYGTATGGGANQTNMEAEITEVRLLVNGSVQRVFSGEQLFNVNAFRGIAFATGIIPIYFSAPWARSAAGEDAPAWHMGDVQSFQMEVDIGGAITPTLTGIAVKEVSNLPMGPIVQWKRGVLQVAATGIVNYAGNGDRDSILAVHGFETTAADITDVEVKVDERQVFKATRAQATAIYADHGFTMEADVFSIAWDHTSRIADALQVARLDGANKVIGDRALSFDFNMAVAANVTLLTETLGFRA